MVGKRTNLRQTTRNNCTQIPRALVRIPVLCLCIYLSAALTCNTLQKRQKHTYIHIYVYIFSLRPRPLLRIIRLEIYEHRPKRQTLYVVRFQNADAARFMRCPFAYVLLRKKLPKKNQKN